MSAQADRIMAQKILIVDDDVLIPRLYQQHLERAGYQVVTATNGAEGIEVTARELPDLIIMDVMMEVMDGLAALRLLKKMETTNAIPVIVITATAHEAARHESEVSGAALFLTKPVSPAQLLLEVQRLIPGPSLASLSGGSGN